MDLVVSFFWLPRQEQEGGSNMQIMPYMLKVASTNNLSCIGNTYSTYNQILMGTTLLS